MRAELVVDAHAQLGEGPLWDPRTKELLWVDILAGVVHRYDPRTGADRPFDAGSYVGAVVPRAAAATPSPWPTALRSRPPTAR